MPYLANAHTEELKRLDNACRTNDASYKINDQRVTAVKNSVDNQLTNTNNRYTDLEARVTGCESDNRAIQEDTSLLKLEVREATNLGRANKDHINVLRPKVDDLEKQLDNTKDDLKDARRTINRLDDQLKAREPGAYRGRTAFVWLLCGVMGVASVFFGQHVKKVMEDNAVLKKQLKWAQKRAAAAPQQPPAALAEAQPPAALPEAAGFQIPGIAAVRGLLRGSVDV